jgi:two-component system, chemotaxis family, protein-glutamate methylesterase/glutaminase
MARSPSENAARAPHRVDLVVIGGSAGALDALAAFLPLLPRGWPLPIALVVHLPRNAPDGLAAVLGTYSVLPVAQAEDKQPLAPGTIYVGAPGYHLLVDEGPALALSVDDPVHFSMPSVDVLFESAAATCGPRVAGLLLSGANEDGANGLAAICAAGGVAAVQAPEEALVATMPRAALRRCPGATVLPAAAISDFLCSLAGARSGDA